VRFALPSFIHWSIIFAATSHGMSPVLLIAMTLWSDLDRRSNSCCAFLTDLSAASYCVLCFCSAALGCCGRAAIAFSQELMLAGRFPNA
jgi:hypothetical protein